MMRYLFSLFKYNKSKSYFFSPYSLFSATKNQHLNGFNADALRQLLPFDMQGTMTQLAELFDASLDVVKHENEGSNTIKGYDAEGHVVWLVRREAINLSATQCDAAGHYEWLSLELSLTAAKVLTPQLIALAWKLDLCLLDWQAPVQKTWGMTSVVHDATFLCRQRSNQLKEKLLTGMKGIRNIFTVENRVMSWEQGIPHQKCYMGFAVVFCRRKGDCRTLQELAGKVKDLLACDLAEEEQLRFNNHAFQITHDKYEISFTMEGWNKNPSLMVHMDTPEDAYDNSVAGDVVVAPLGRPCVSKMMRMIRELCPSDAKKSDIVERMNTRHLENRFPNSTERLAYSIRMEKKLRKIDLGVRSSRSGGRYGSNFAIHDYEHRTAFNSYTESLYMEESVFEFLAPSINKFVEGGIEWYSFLNMIHYPAWRAIAADLKKISWLIEHDVYSSELDDYVNKFSLSSLSDDDNYDYNKGEKYDREFLYQHRKKLLRFYSFMIEWIDSRCSDLLGQDVAINIEGL